MVRVRGRQTSTTSSSSGAAPPAEAKDTWAGEGALAKTHSVLTFNITAVFLVSSRGQCGDEQNMKICTLGTSGLSHLSHIGPKIAPMLE